MKNNFFIIALILMLFAPIAMKAQKTPLPFFDKTGNIRLQTVELDALADTIAIVNHRADDIVWYRIVYRVIDMREKQNYRLYFPIRPDNPTYRSLFKVMLDAICDDGLTAYERGRELTPKYEIALTPEDLRANTILPKDRDEEPNAYLIEVDDLLGKPTVNTDNFAYYVRNQLKYITQEVIFFDKHTSKMHSKVIGIAPLYSAHPDKSSGNLNAMQSLQYSLLFWVLFDDLRPYLAKQYVISNGNEAQRLTFDDFFVQKLYSSYLLGDNNMYSRMLLEYDKVVSPEQFETYVKKEQKRIETELLNFELDLWEF
ncbi:gliding motility protein GldN [Paludibacter sp. 221]|uniref:type IX secretion system ring protein PorN/GldN n=1 Tax=Paludibacter sp. 221 TaxID=2302939 RepID=UPI0013D4421C|nr:gliding motility protein GldN [Paludibacter sp. 221]NDV46348.1 gliding motility protein GldN [Paludibacter sp. 221]